MKKSDCCILSNTLELVGLTLILNGHYLLGAVSTLVGFILISLLFISGKSKYRLSIAGNYTIVVIGLILSFISSSPILKIMTAVSLVYNYIYYNAIMTMKQKSAKLPIYLGLISTTTLMVTVMLITLALNYLLHIVNYEIINYLPFLLSLILPYATLACTYNKTSGYKVVPVQLSGN